MIATHRGLCVVAILFWVMSAFSSLAQPTLPDITGSNENGFALLSWTCQYDGVKSISVLRSTDSNFNYSTVGYVKNLYKGVQAFVDGHPIPGKNFYKLFIVFNSGLTWRSNHYGVYIDSASINPKRIVPSNEALQKMIVTEGLGQKPETTKVVKKPEQTRPQTKGAPADRDKYTETLKKNMDVLNDTSFKRPNFKITSNDDSELATINDPSKDVKKKMTLSYNDDTGEINAGSYIVEGKPADAKKKISITFDDQEDVSAFIETLPKSNDRKITISYNEDTEEVEAEDYIGEDADEPAKKETKLTKIQAQQPKQISMTFKSDEAAQAYIESLHKSSRNKITLTYTDVSNPKPVLHPDAGAGTKPANNPVATNTEVKPAEPPKPKISIKFTDDPSANPSVDVRSKYVLVDQVTGHVRVTLPNDVATHSYSIRFFDKDNRAVIEVPKLNTPAIILDKRNFQKKGIYKFTIRRDVTELESGYINIF